PWLSVVNADGTKPRRLTRVSAETRARWTRDAKALAYPVGRGLRELDVRTDVAHEVLTTLGHIDQFAWSPDGRQIVFSRYERTENLGKYGWRLSTASSDGT